MGPTLGLQYREPHVCFGIDICVGRLGEWRVVRRWAEAAV